ncbi:cobalamin-independent methionine synthase II family protein [Paludibaculum fermentans]|uniref:Cobalamin-independent methionine synthase II family protein n=1 Tax=Paludibaculum fermentans TaxID=1473598 RepID=A0A7S7NQ52_PALFE|nr:cobalamin-independent methionine synthase II family protein [Paludibaculum fermentans]QOY87751.1 cobalamin-independent methionine synthase II family protein [Paludibaculum fermentans]
MAIKTTVVGSYPIPHWLPGDTSRTTLRDAILVVLKTQELAGIDVVADGELNRFDPGHPETNGMIDYFVSKMDGIRTRFSLEDIEAFRADQGLTYRTDPAGIVTGPITGGTLNLPRDFEFTRKLTSQPLKFTCTGPHMLTKVLTDRHYKSRPELCMAIADVLRKQLTNIDADIVQLDEANISGHPEDAEWALPALNHVLEGIAGVRALHICFGNYGGQSVQKGFWQNLLPFLNGLQVDHLVLEFARRGYAELEHFKGLDPRIGMGLGVVDIKDNGVESPDLIAERIELAAGVLGPERLHYIHPDCGFWMLQRNVADRKMAALVAGRNLYEGRS